MNDGILIVASWAALTTLLWKIVDWVKLIRAQDWNGVVTQAVVWIGGVLVIFIGTASNLTAGIPVPGTELTLADLNAASVILAGMQLGSVASVGYDAKKARDNNDSAKMPSLLGS